MPCRKRLPRAAVVPFRLLALAVSAAFPLAADAQQPAHLGSVSVTAPRLAELPLNASTVAEGELRSRRTGTSDAASLLGNVSGVTLYGAGGVSSLPSIRGLADDRLMTTP